MCSIWEKVSGAIMMRVYRRKERPAAQEGKGRPPSGPADRGQAFAPLLLTSATTVRENAATCEYPSPGPTRPSMPSRAPAPPPAGATLSPKVCLQVAKACACFHLRKAARVVTQIYDESLSPAGLSSGQFVLLLAVRLLDAPTLQQLAATIWVDRTALGRTVQPLARRGYVRVTRGEDRRARVVTLTPAGHRALRTGYAHWKKAQRRMLRLLGNAGLKSLLATLDDSLRALRPAPGARSARRRARA